MSAPFADRLIEAVRAKQTPLCVGLDPFADRVPALFGAKTSSCMPQPNWGSIWRSPGAVASTSQIACSISCSAWL